MKVMYLDESGDHDLTLRDPANNVFIIGGIIVDRTYARTVMEQRIREFKVEWFGSEDIILHSTDIAGGRGGFEVLRTDRVFRNECLSALSELMQELEYQVVACVIHKDRHVARYGAKALDPYDFGLQVVVECFCREIGDTIDGGIIYAEKRRPDLDHGLDVAWERLRAKGTYNLNEHRRRQIDERIIGLSLKAKNVNIAGLQLADLVIWPIAREQRGLNSHDNWEIVKSKMCRVKDGRIDGYGLVVLPR